MATKTIGSDTFVRSNASGWGTSSGGDTWATNLGSPTLSIASNKGHAASISSQAAMQLGSTTSQNMEGLVRAQTNNTNSLRMGVALRFTSSNTFYHARLSANANNLVIGKIVSGSNTDLFTTSFTVSTATYYWVRFRIVGSNLYARVWADGGSEPGTWTLTGTDSSITGSGGFGLTINANNTNSTWDFDSFTVTDATTTIVFPMRTVIATQVTKIFKTRTKISTGVTKIFKIRTVLTNNLNTWKFKLRSIISTNNTKIFNLRSIVSTQAAKSFKTRAVIRTQNTKQFKLRAPIATQNSLLFKLRAKVFAGGTKAFKTRTIIKTQVTNIFKLRLRLSITHNWLFKLRIKLRTQNTRVFQLRLIAKEPPLFSGGFTLFANGTGVANYDSFRVTEYPDSSLSLSKVLPRLGSSSVSWNALTPANTTLGIDTSIDGVNWTDVTASNGGSIPGLLSQPVPSIDAFDTNTSSNYTSTSKSGGNNGTWVYDTFGYSRITGTSAAGFNGSLYVYTPLNFGDGWTMVDMDQSDSGGIVIHYQDTNNLYYCVICDSQSNVNKNTLGLYKYLASTTTHPASTVNINFPRGTFHRFRLQYEMGTITIYMDEYLLISYTDPSPITSGMSGLFNDSGTSRYYHLWLQQFGSYVSGTPAYDVVTGQFVYTRQRLSTSTSIATPQVEDITTLGFAPTIERGVLIPSVAYRSAFISRNYDDLAKQCNFYWFIDQNLLPNFRSFQSSPSPWILQSTQHGIGQISDIEIDSNLELDVENDLYRNRQKILGAIDTTSLLTETFYGDGSKKTFPLGFAIDSTPTLTLNGIVQSSVGLKGSTGYTWYYAIGDLNIVQDQSAVSMSSSDSLVVQYYGQFSVDVTVDNVVEQSARSIIEGGGTGIVEYVEDHSNDDPKITKDAAITLATNLISRYAIAGRTLIFTTSRNGLQIGQTLTIFLPEHGIWEGQFLIIQVEMKLQKGVGDTQVWWYKITCSELPKQASWAKIIATGIGLNQ